MTRNKSPRQVTPKTRNTEEVIRRTPPHLLREHNRKHLLNRNESTSMSHPISNIRNPINTNTGQLAYGGSSLPLQDGGMCTGIVPQEGETKRFLYLPMLLSIISKASKSSPYEEGTPGSSDTEHHWPCRGGQSGGSNSRTADYNPTYRLSSFYPVAPYYANGNDNWNHSDQHQELAHLHCNEPGREEQPPLPSYWSSQDTNTNIVNNTTITRETSSWILGKRPAASNPSQSFFFQQPPTQKPFDAPDMGPDECIDELFNLVQSVGTPDYLSSWEKVFRSAAREVIRSGSNGSTASEPCLTLGLGHASTFDKGKAKEVRSYWAPSPEMGDSMKKQRKTDQSLSTLTLGLDGDGCSKNTE